VDQPPVDGQLEPRPPRREVLVQLSPPGVGPLRRREDPRGDLPGDAIEERIAVLVAFERDRREPAAGHDDEQLPDR
jgi:hypothetical protein